MAAAKGIPRRGDLSLWWRDTSLVIGEGTSRTSMKPTAATISAMTRTEAQHFRITVVSTLAFGGIVPKDGHPRLVTVSRW